MQRAVGLLVDVDELAEDADDLVARIQRDGADLDIDPVAVLLEENDLRVGDSAVPAIFLANTSRARRVSSGAQTEVNCRPLTSPTTLRAAGLTQRMIPYLSIT